VNELLSCHNIRFADASLCKIHDTTAGNTENAKSGTKVFV